MYCNKSLWLTFYEKWCSSYFQFLSLIFTWRGFLWKTSDFWFCQGSFKECLMRSLPLFCSIYQLPESCMIFLWNVSAKNYLKTLIWMFIHPSLSERKYFRALFSLGEWLSRNTLNEIMHEIMIIITVIYSSYPKTWIKLSSTDGEGKNSHIPHIFSVWLLCCDLYYG